MTTMGGTIVPKYNYMCELCQREWNQWNSIEDSTVECPHCFCEKVKKLPPAFFVIKNKKTIEEKSAKQNVVEHIEENREVLKQMRQEAKKKEFVKDV